jgi:hypothetical protein
MEALTALSLAGTIVQFVQFSIELYSQSRKLYRSSLHGSLPADVIDTEVIANDLHKQIDRLKAYAALAGQSIDEDLRQLYNSCISVAEELSSILRRLRVNGTGGKWASFKAAMRSVRTLPQVDDLKRRLDALTREVQLYVNAD